MAQSIFWKCYDRHRSDDEFMAEVSRGRAIVSICSRPKHPAVFPMLTETGQIATPIESNNKETQTDEVLINGDIMIDRKIKPEPENFHDDFIPLVASGDESGDDNGISAANNDDQLMETNVVHNNYEQRNQTKRGQKNYRSVLPRSSKVTNERLTLFDNLCILKGQGKCKTTYKQHGIYSQGLNSKYTYIRE